MKCYCSICDNEIQLINTKDRETGMYYNYWHCEEHGKVDPVKGPESISTFVARMQKEFDEFLKIYPTIEEQAAIGRKK